jgi:hypothetical protein
MEEKKRKKQEETEITRSLNYEDILNGFALETDKNSVAASRTDLDGLAMAELLGEEVKNPSQADAVSGHFDAIGASDYSELARQFEELDLSEYSRNNIEPTAIESIQTTGDYGIPEKFPGLSDDSKLDDDDLPPEDTVGYAALLDQLESEIQLEPYQPAALEATVSEETSEEEQRDAETVQWDQLLQIHAEMQDEPAESAESVDTPMKTEVLSIVNLTKNMDTTPLDQLDEESAEPQPEETIIAESEGLDLSDLFAEEAQTSAVDVSETAILPKQETKSAPPLETAHTGVDFLGLTGLASPVNHAGGKPGERMEVLFEGVEMDFNDQSDNVTLAELLLAQGKKKEANDIYQKVSQQKGTTFWVAKRLRSLTANPEK